MGAISDVLAPVMQHGCALLALWAGVAVWLMIGGHVLSGLEYDGEKANVGEFRLVTIWPVRSRGAALHPTRGPCAPSDR